MTIPEIEDRLRTLEEAVERLKARLEGPGGPSHPSTEPDSPTEPWHVRGAGRFKDDPIFEEIVRLARDYRQSLPITGDIPADDHP